MDVLEDISGKFFNIEHAISFKLGALVARNILDECEASNMFNSILFKMVGSDTSGHFYIHDVGHMNDIIVDSVLEYYSVTSDNAKNLDLIKAILLMSLDVPCKLSEVEEGKVPCLF